MDKWYNILKTITIKTCHQFHLLASPRVIQKWNIIQLSQKSTPFDAFDEIYQIVIDGISDNMASLVQSSKYGVINTADKPTEGFYVIMFTSESYKLQDNTTIDR